MLPHAPPPHCQVWLWWPPALCSALSGLQSLVLPSTHGIFPQEKSHSVINSRFRGFLSVACLIRRVGTWGWFRTQTVCSPSRCNYSDTATGSREQRQSWVSLRRRGVSVERQCADSSFRNRVSSRTMPLKAAWSRNLSSSPGVLCKRPETRRKKGSQFRILAGTRTASQWGGACLACGWSRFNSRHPVWSPEQHQEEPLCITGCYPQKAKCVNK